MNFQTVLKFWFEEIDPKFWFIKDPKFDREIRQRFQPVLEQALKGELYSWRQDESGRLAEIIVLDQFSRNIHRDHPQSFAADPIALTLAQEAVHWKLDQKMEMKKRGFFYMPYMHSESKVIHEVAINLFSQAGLEENLKFEWLHKEIIDRFGRFPHRNQILGRKSTADEIEFLEGPGSSF